MREQVTQIMRNSLDSGDIGGLRYLFHDFHVGFLYAKARELTLRQRAIMNSTLSMFAGGES